jgi:hypothetical protein
MMGASQSPSLSRRTRVTDPRALLRMAWASSRPLTFVGVAMLLTLAATMVGLLLDPRVITGAPAWQLSRKVESILILPDGL